MMMFDYESDSRDGQQPDMIAVTRAEWERVHEALKAVEWVVRAGGAEFCPWCKGLYPDHAPDCQRQAALAAMDS